MHGLVKLCYEMHVCVAAVAMCRGSIGYAWLWHADGCQICTIIFSLEHDCDSGVLRPMLHCIPTQAYLYSIALSPQQLRCLSMHLCIANPHTVGISRQQLLDQGLQDNVAIARLLWTFHDAQNVAEPAFAAVSMWDVQTPIFMPAT